MSALIVGVLLTMAIAIAPAWDWYWARRRQKQLDRMHQLHGYGLVRNKQQRRTLGGKNTSTGVPS